MFFSLGCNLTDPFRELKKLVAIDPGFDGTLPCVEVDKGIICGDFGKFEQTSTVKRFSFRGEKTVQFHPKQFGNSRNYHQPRRKREGHL